MKEKAEAHHLLPHSSSISVKKESNPPFLFFVLEEKEKAEAKSTKPKQDTIHVKRKIKWKVIETIIENQ